MSLSPPLHRRRCDLLSHRIAAVPFTLTRLRRSASGVSGQPPAEWLQAPVGG
jgi:hypothetical protein